MMDSKTFKLFFENDEGTKSNVSIDLNLTEEEQITYQTIKSHNWRLEQEKIPQSYVIKSVQSLCNTTLEQ